MTLNHRPHSTYKALSLRHKVLSMYGTMITKCQLCFPSVSISKFPSKYQYSVSINDGYMAPSYKLEAYINAYQHI